MRTNAAFNIVAKEKKKIAQKSFKFVISFVNTQVPNDGPFFDRIENKMRMMRSFCKLFFLAYIYHFYSL